MSLMLDRLCEQACACSPSFFGSLQLRQKLHLIHCTPIICHPSSWLHTWVLFWYFLFFSLLHKLNSSFSRVFLQSCRMQVHCPILFGAVCSIHNISASVHRICRTPKLHVICQMYLLGNPKRAPLHHPAVRWGIPAPELPREVVGVYRHTQICVMLWQRAPMIFWVKMPLNFLLIRGFLLVLATGSAWISSCLPALLSSFQTPCRLRQHLVDGSSNLAKYTPGAASRPTNVFWIVLRSHQPSLFEVLFECCQSFVEDLRQRQTSK